MKKSPVCAQFQLLLFSFFLLTSCYGQEKASLPDRELLGPYNAILGESEPTLWITAYIESIYQEESGVFWFGTSGSGVIRYAGDSLKYFSTKEGFGGKTVRAIAEDKYGHIWFGTNSGLTKYDGQCFTNFTEKDGLIHNDIWSMAIDQNGTIWIGTLGGACRYDGEIFTPFDIPASEADSTRYVSSPDIIHCIMEDRNGKIWFGTNGGVYIYDGKKLSHISQKDGLCDNYVNQIMEDKSGNFWFATQRKGVCRWDGNSFTQIDTERGFKGYISSDVFEDNSGNIWFPMEGVGLHRYGARSDGGGMVVENFFQKQHCVSHTIRCTYQDNEGRLWFGSWLGLFRYDPPSAGDGE